MTPAANDKAGKNFWVYLAITAGALLLLIPAFYNRYPLVNPDTATYLASGFKPETPFDRPITYGLLVRLFSINGLSLWLVVAAQAIIVSSLIFMIVKRISSGGAYVIRGLLTVLLLSVGSSLSWTVCQVQPDVFTSIAFLCIILLLMGDESTRMSVVLYVLFFISVAVHMSHPLLMVGVLLLLLMIKRFTMGKVAPSYTKAAVVMIALSGASILLMGSALSKSKHVYFVGSLLEKGVLKTYLDDNCAINNYRICEYKEELGNSSDDFLWNNTSVLYKIGDWKGTKKEFSTISQDILTTPTYLKQYVSATLRQFCRQLTTCNIGDGNQRFAGGSNVAERIGEYFPAETNSFLEARQNKTDMLAEVSAPNKVFDIIIILAVAVPGYAFSQWRKMLWEMKLLVLVCFIGVILNSLDCAAFGVVNGRYGCKMIWLLPFCALCYPYSLRSARSRQP